MNERKAVIGVAAGAGLGGHAPRGLDLEISTSPERRGHR